MLCLKDQVLLEKFNDMSLDIIAMSWKELRENLVHNSVSKIMNII